MKSVVIGVFTDTHANLHALEAILAFFEKAKCKEIIHLGDCVCMGAYPKECLEIILRSGRISTVRGNHDGDYLNNITKKRGNSHVPEAHKEKSFALAGDEYRKDIEKLPYIIYKEWFGRRFAFTHYARYFNVKEQREMFYTIEEFADAVRLDEMFSYIEADTVFYGHKHSPSTHWGKRLYMDLGALACHKGNLARGLILKVYEDGTFTAERIYVPYDREASLKAMQERDIPGIDEMEKYYYAGN